MSSLCIRSSAFKRSQDGTEPTHITFQEPDKDSILTIFITDTSMDYSDCKPFDVCFAFSSEVLKKSSFLGTVTYDNAVATSFYRTTFEDDSLWTGK